MQAMVSLKLQNNATPRTLRDWRSWLRTARPATDVAVLDRRHVYILPTRQGWVFALILASMLIGAINYALSLGFALTFMLVGLGVVAMLHTWRNLAGITLTAGRSAPVFAGEDADVTLIASEIHHRGRYAIAACYDADPNPVYADIPADGRGEFHFTVPATQRGWLDPGRLTVHTEFPLGLFRAWAYVELNHRILIYPRPAPPGIAPPPGGDHGHTGKHSAAHGDDDFAGLRNYTYGDSLRRIDWKASSREQGIYTKQFQGTSSDFLWLDWQLLEGNTEVRISQLTRWVLDAHDADMGFGLRLPGQEFMPERGAAHFHRCLQALALFGSDA